MQSKIITMTKDQAIAAMRSGKKVTHMYFSPEEWITMKGYMIVTEKGCEYTAEEFWRYHQTERWNDGWSIVYEQEPEEVHII